MRERLQKIISACGLASRRAAEEMITAGRVRVNGKIAALGESADLKKDKIELDGRRLVPAREKLYIMLNKPRGYVTTMSDEKGRKTVADLIADIPERLYPVGRLDMASEGLLVMTNDGAFANFLAHPSHEVEKEYLVSVSGDYEAALEPLSKGVELEDGPTMPAAVYIVSSGEEGAVLSITIHEGRNRQVRYMCEAVGLRVRRLRRISEGKLKLGDLAPGKWRRITPTELAKLGWEPEGRGWRPTKK